MWVRTSRSTCLISRGFLYECNGWAQAIVNTKALNVVCCAPKHFVKVFLSENIFVRLKHICTPGAPHFLYTLSRQFIVIVYAVDPQSFKNYLRHTLIFTWNSAILLLSCLATHEATCIYQLLLIITMVKGKFAQTSKSLKTWWTWSSEKFSFAFYVFINRFNCKKQSCFG